MNESIPKIFISYSWSSSERVLALATRLMGDGVEVVLDKWELKEGQDKYVFMEQSVVDPSIDKVLLVCNKSYAEKANTRKGGVGDETMVISPEVYEKATETKYIPVIFEHDENGAPYTPAYLKTRIYIDLCEDNAHYEQEYEKLLRNIHNKPENRKPALGEIPEWLNDESVDFSGVRNTLKQVQAYDGMNKSKAEYNTRKFCDEFILSLLSLAPPFDKDFDETLLKQIDAAKPLRDLFYVDALTMSNLDSGSVLGDFFERTYNETYTIEGRNSYHDAEFEFAHFINWEMFIGATAILLHCEKYCEINNLLHRTYFLSRYPTGHGVEANTYIQFCLLDNYIDNSIKPKSENPRKHTLAGDIAVKREKRPLITQQSLVNADMMLYKLSCVYDFPDELHVWRWFPMLYVYGDSHYYRQPLWSKMVSKKCCEKLFSLFGVSSIDKLKEAVEKNKSNGDIRYRGSYFSAASIQQSIELEKIGSMP